MESAVQKIELFMSCRGLDDLDTVTVSDPFVVVMYKNQNAWVQLGRTERVDNNLNPNFTQSMILDYRFEEQQYLRFEVYHYVNDQSAKIIGTNETTVASIVGGKDQIYMGDLMREGKLSGKLIVKADQVKNCNDEISMSLSGKKIIETRFWFFHSTNPFLRFYRLRKDDGNPILVHQTEPQMSNKNPNWGTMTCKAQKLCNGDYLMPVKIELWDFRNSGKHVYLGSTQISVKELEEKKTVSLQVKDKAQKCVGSVNIDNFQLKRKASFLDFLAGGLQLNLVVAIDFTASNKNPLDPSSLHYGENSQYSQAILAVGNILINYDYDKQVPVYGFGCKPQMTLINTNETLHCFALNDNPSDPEVYGLDGILQVYKSNVRRLYFDGPTYLHPILSESMRMAKAFKDDRSDNYIILMILTDGETHDLQLSINDIIASSHLPISVIIIGIGNADFKNMERLDNDDMSMTDSNGKKAQRDLVQFVPFNQFKGDAALLAKEVLQELPDQVVEYFELIKTPPKPPNNMSMSQHYNRLQGQQQFHQMPPQQPPPPQQPLPNQYQPPIQQNIQYQQVQTQQSMQSIKISQQYQQPPYQQPGNKQPTYQQTAFQQPYGDQYNDAYKQQFPPQNQKFNYPPPQ